MTEFALILILGLLGLSTALLLGLYRKAARGAHPDPARLDAFEKNLERTERTLREELARGREEQGKAAREQRQETAEAFRLLGESLGRRVADAAAAQKGQLEAFSAQLAAFSRASGERLDGARAEAADGARLLREELVRTLNGIAEKTTGTIKDLAVAEKARLEGMSATIGRLADTNGTKLEEIRATVEGRLQAMQADNARQLDLVRQTVDEKLQGTLEKRLGDSFRQVSERLEAVNRGLGEMQALATGVGDLKKVLSNVKARGTWGEVQLRTLLDQVLAPDQFDANVSTKEGGERVEYAIRLPGPGADRDETVWLPIDAKFPLEDYQRLTEAQERADAEGAESAGKQLEARVRGCARDIRDKYLNPPRTTDFGIMFLPLEGLFAEVIRRRGLTELVQRECRVVIAGPTTLWSILNSLQMGFHTLAIQKRSSEVWQLLAAVKTEWTKYGDVLEGVQKKLHQASETIEKARVRSRAVGRRLRDVQALPADEARALLPRDLPEEDGADEAL